MQIPPDQDPDLQHCHNVYFVLPSAILVSIYTEKRPNANQLLLLQINDSHGKLSTDTIDNISITSAYTRRQWEEHVVTVIRHVQELQRVGIQAKVIGAELANDMVFSWEKTKM